MNCYRFLFHGSLSMFYMNFLGGEKKLFLFHHFGFNLNYVIEKSSILSDRPTRNWKSREENAISNDVIN